MYSGDVCGAFMCVCYVSSSVHVYTLSFFQTAREVLGLQVGEQEQKEAISVGVDS